VLSTTGGNMPGEMRLTFYVSLIAMGLLFATLWKFELASKHAKFELKRLRRRLEVSLEDERARGDARSRPAATVPPQPVGG
jgi:heme exporter protein C